VRQRVRNGLPAGSVVPGHRKSVDHRSDGSIHADPRTTTPRRS
jgi:hypothetical protein